MTSQLWVLEEAGVPGENLTLSHWQHSHIPLAEFLSLTVYVYEQRGMTCVTLIYYAFEIFENKM